MLTPKARGDLSERLLVAMRDSAPVPQALVELEPESIDDEQIALWALYELHYGGFEDVAPDREWDPTLLTVRARLEGSFETRLRSRYVPPEEPLPFAASFFSYVEAGDGPSVAAFVHRQADREQVLELLRHKTLYHLKEFDPVAWVVPRLSVRVKASLMEVQFDEYGNGDPNRLHAHLFAEGIRAAGLDPAPGAYVDDAPVEALELNNAMSMFGLHRRLRGAALGHLAAFEVHSSVPARRMAQGLERLDFPQTLIDYYTEHVEADAVHEQLAVREVCGSLVEDEPALLDDVYFGGFTSVDLEDRFARALLGSWAA